MGVQSMVGEVLVGGNGVGFVCTPGPGCTPKTMHASDLRHPHLTRHGRRWQAACTQAPVQGEGEGEGEGEREGGRGGGGKRGGTGRTCLSMYSLKLDESRDRPMACMPLSTYWQVPVTAWCIDSMCACVRACVRFGCMCKCACTCCTCTPQTWYTRTRICTDI